MEEKPILNHVNIFDTIPNDILSYYRQGTIYSADKMTLKNKAGLH